MRFKVINLARTPDRLYNFKKNNPDFKFERFEAVDGSKIDRRWLVDTGLATPECAGRYTDGAIGVALSHRALWQECVNSGIDYTILEDDAYLTRDFNDISYRIARWSSGWDFIFWGANFDQRLAVEFSPGIAVADVRYNVDDLVKNIGNITNQAIQPHLYRTHWAVGLVCYTIRPKTAKYLLDVVFPLHDYVDWRDNHGIDNSIIEELRNMNAAISLPPIALTLNDRHNSTVQVGPTPPPR